MRKVNKDRAKRLGQKRARKLAKVTRKNKRAAANKKAAHIRAALTKRDSNDE